MMTDLSPKRMALLVKYVEAGMDEEEIAHAMINWDPPTKYCKSARERIAKYFAEGKSETEVAEIFGVKVESFRKTLWRLNIKAVAPVERVVVAQPPPRPSAYRLARFDPVVARVCSVYEASRGVA